ncbi:hypothetical protein [Streptomyces sp. WMMC897]|uniref:hypothetical protein n=1 Tax=Streptomyces sp. WMMC897 TaxID=3014782 RepID=UPI0022B6C2EE|nr:hypothetical protein [Streptomyces sp. WMMC897]MCZ7413039.1 hypothetical protein [Streptomyces sp. WMMC897]MCZ7413079.1 hypothetical protein [Streptomyces sp. WMMC897]MCZ7415449.1 hypothetical protein [Streptomyces sp. WMMC897]
MSKTVLTDVRLFAVGADLSGHSNKVELAVEVEDKDATNYRSQGWTEKLGGLASAEVTGEGQWEADDPGMVDDASWSQLGGTGPWTLGANNAAAVGDLAYLVKAMRSEYKLGEAVGEVAPWTGTAKSSWPVARGVFAHPPGTARTATGSGTGLELGAVASGQRLYAALHVLSAAGATPTLTVTVESSADNTFAAPTTQLTFAAADEAGGQILRTGGTAVTDTWWRIAWTITGTSPSFLFVSSLGIQ